MTRAAVMRGLAQAVPILALCAAWEIFARSGAVTPFMLPPLDEVLVRIYDDAVGGDLLRNIAVTLYRAFAGFFIATPRRRPARRRDVAQRAGTVVLRPRDLGRLPDAEDRVPAGGDPLARPL